MKINISLEAEIDFDIKIDNSILNRVARYYNGDFEKWALENYSDYFDIDDMEIYVEDCTFDNKEAKKLLENVREIIGSDEDDLTTVAKNRTKLLNSEVHNNINEKNIKQVEIDLATIERVATYCDFSSPKVELNYIHMIDNTIEATDTKRLIKYESSLSVDQEIFFPPYFIEPLKNGGTCFINSDGDLLLKYNDCFYKGLDKKSCCGSIPKFPNTNSIVADIKNPKLIKIPYSKVKINLVSNDEFGKVIEINMCKNKIYLQESFWNEASIEDIKEIGFTNIIEPIYLFGDKFEIVMMPLFIDDTVEFKTIR